MCVWDLPGWHVHAQKGQACSQWLVPLQEDEGRAGQAGQTRVGAAGDTGVQAAARPIQNLCGGASNNLEGL